MRLDSEFIRLPLRFDAERLKQEVAQFSERDWAPHPQGFPGNWALPFISAQGDPTDDGVRGPMRPTPHLDRCPYIRQIFASFGCVVGRSRLMRLDSRAETTAHVDTNYYWLKRVRIHVPIVTLPEVRFHCGSRQIHMAAGECWLFDTWKMHNVINPNDFTRIHLVADCTGSKEFWKLARQGYRPFGPAAGSETEPAFVPYRPGAAPELRTEDGNFPVVMSPGEQREFHDWLFGELAASARQHPSHVARLRASIDAFMAGWQKVWDQHGEGRGGWARYEQLRRQLGQELEDASPVRMLSGLHVNDFVQHAFIHAGFNPDLADGGHALTRGLNAPSVSAIEGQVVAPSGPRAPAATAMLRHATGDEPRIERPVVVVSAPRSGSTFLFETLERSPGLKSIGGESHQLIEQFPRLRPEAHQWRSNALTAADAGPQIRKLLPQAFLEQCRDARGTPPKGAVRLLEKTPKNALRIPFFDAVFPDALFIYLYREPRGNLSSIMEAWRSKRFVTYPDLPDWKGPPWSLLLIPGWQDLAGQPLERIALRQWQSTNQIILDELEKLPRERWCAVDYDTLASDPQPTYQRLCAFAGVEPGAPLTPRLPLSKHTLTAPAPEKWKKNQAEIERVLPETAAVTARAQRVLAEDRAMQAPVQALPAPPPANAAPPDPGATPPAESAAPPGPLSGLKSVHTGTVPPLLQQLNASLLVSTYQAGKLVVIRARDNALNTHFRLFPKPMGMDMAGGRLALGVRSGLEMFHNVPAAAPRLEPPGSHDAVFVPRGTHVTGDIDIHEMVFDRDGVLWIVNTRFCCLCTLDPDHSFTPRWRPPFVTELAPEDRCHLNGVATRNGKVRYVTALAQTDAPGAWRQHKAAGGVLIDIDDNRVVAQGLSMPHSPRWYRDQLWVLESGKGSLARVDEKTGEVTTVATLPGFTRGLDFVGPFAFVGLSQVRETASFAGLPITEKMGERNCGVWIVNIENGRTVGFVRFEGKVQEIFAIKALSGMRWPDVLEPQDKIVDTCYVLPDAALADVPKGRRVQAT